MHNSGHKNAQILRSSLELSVSSGANGASTSNLLQEKKKSFYSGQLPIQPATTYGSSGLVKVVPTRSAKAEESEGSNKLHSSGETFASDQDKANTNSSSVEGTKSQ